MRPAVTPCPAARPVVHGAPENAGSQRLLATARRGDLLDRALWTVPATSGWGAGSATALVGSSETVAQAFLDYVDLGFEIFGVRGDEDFLTDAAEFGRHVIPLVRQEVAHREATGWVGGHVLADRALTEPPVPPEAHAPEPA